MASTSNRTSRQGSTRKSPARRSSASGNGTSRSGARGSSNRKIDARQAERDSALFHEIGLIVLFIAMVILFCCNLGLIGPVGDSISGVMFGLLGLTAYVAPVFCFIGVAFWMANEGNPIALRKLISGIVLFLMVGVLCDLLAKNASSLQTYDIKAIYEGSKLGKNGGGVFGGSLAYLLHHYLETVGAVLVVILCSVISIILLTEKSFLNGVRNGSNRLRERSAESAERRREEAEYRREETLSRREEQERLRVEREEERRMRADEQERLRAEREEERRQRTEEQERLRAEREEERRLRAEGRENDKILRRVDVVASGVTFDTELKKPEENLVGHGDDIHEIVFKEEGDPEEISSVYRANQNSDYEEITPISKTERSDGGWREMPLTAQAEQIRIHKEGVTEPVSVVDASSSQKDSQPVSAGMGKSSSAGDGIQKEIRTAEKKTIKKYIFPPLSRLQKGKLSAGDSTKELKETAMRLQQTLNTFGVKVTITDISQGPSVTRYELQPEQGVKVSKITGLTDDIKLNLAATDIRIEAPIPGKAAIGIEVPNKENMTVALRDLLESKEFKEFPSNIAFAVGKDIAGKTVVADIAKMPHMLIAGATGSGKSVCINTLIMSILYKAHPDDVKLIMVDPKVVELSVYNGIPHLLIPVVTDPRKASAALHWTVSEMEDRYRKFADFNVRDLKGYNKKLETMRENGEEDVSNKLPQIVIIVDELADLMMVSPGEVEESICRLAQLARACGIHLIIATQRPSVDVITGLIKANMPSRVAFAVSSGTDSRTILDMVGAEKLLGKGDMLFYPQGYSKPARIQGAFVSDKEVSDVVDFLKNQMLGNTYAEEIEEKIKNIGSVSSGGSSGGAGNSGGGDSRDEYFADAGRLIIENEDKASIGMLQRAFKIGFNRAARIMDQLCEYGVVGESEGTKSRKVLMSMEEFEQLLQEI